MHSCTNYTGSDRVPAAQRYVYKYKEVPPTIGRNEIVVCRIHADIRLVVRLLAEVTPSMAG